MAGYYHPDKTSFISLVHLSFSNQKCNFANETGTSTCTHTHSKQPLEGETHLNRRRGRFKQQGIRLVGENRRFGPQAAQPTSARIQVIQVIRNPSPPFNQDTDMVQFQPRTVSNLLQRCDL